MRRISGGVLALSLSAAVAVSLAPATAQTTRGSAADVVASIGAENAIEEYEEAQRQFLEQAAAEKKEARAESDAVIAASLKAVRNADRVRKETATAYSKRRTLDNYRKMISAQARHDQLVLAAPRVKAAADMAYRVNERAISLALYDVALWPYGARRYTEGNNAPLICEDAYLASVITNSQNRMTDFVASVARARVEFTDLLRKYDLANASLFDTEVEALVAYESAVREYKASPSVVTKSRMEQAKIALDITKPRRIQGVKDLKRSFTNDSKSLLTGAMAQLKSQYEQGIAELRSIGDALDACIIENEGEPF